MYEQSHRTDYANKTARHEIEQQVQEFLKKGGKIQQLKSPLCQTKPKGSVWHPTFDYK